MLGISPLLMATGCEEAGKDDLFSCCTLQNEHLSLSEAVQHVLVYTLQKCTGQMQMARLYKERRNPQC